MIFYVEKKISKKTNQPYVVLMCNVEGNDISITFDKAIIASLMDLKPSEFTNLEVGRYDLCGGSLEY